MRSIFVALTVAAAMPAYAGSASLQHCVSIDDATVRLACYDDVAGRSNSSLQETARSDEKASAPVPQESADTVAEERREAQGLASPGTEQIAPVASAKPAREIGAEQLPESRRPPDDEVEIAATVSDVSRGTGGHLYFHLDNGHIWRQVEPRYLPHPKDGPFNIVISRGMMGEYRLRVEGKGRLVRIRRVQ